jgi:hypothetical protein
LIQEAGGTNGAALPTPQVTGTISMAATAGKVALTTTQTTLTVSNPVGLPEVADFIGFGTTAKRHMKNGAGAGSVQTRPPTCGRAAARRIQNNNATDFTPPERSLRATTESGGSGPTSGRRGTFRRRIAPGRQESLIDADNGNAPGPRFGRLGGGLAVLLHVGRSCFRSSAAHEPPAPAPAAPSRAPPTNRGAATGPRDGASRKAVPAAPRAVDRDQAALDEALRNGDPLLRSMQFGRLFGELVVRNPAAALAYLETMERGGNEYALALFALLKDVGQRDPRRALALAKKLAVTSEQLVVYSVLFDQFAADRAADAVPLLDLVPAGEARNYAIRALTTRWAGQDLETALVWAQRLGNAEDRALAVEAVLFDLSVNEPWRASTACGGAESRRRRDRAHRVPGLRAAEDDRSGPVGGFRPLAAGRRNPDARRAGSRARDGGAGSGASPGMDRQLALPAAEQRATALNNVLDVWLAKSAGAAADYVSRCSGGIPRSRRPPIWRNGWPPGHAAAAVVFRGAA